MERSWLHLALFLALAVLLQGLRLFLPMIPGPVQMFFIGSLLNAVMAAAVWETRTRWALVIGAALPVGAFLQGQLPLLPLVPVVALGNMAFQLAVSCLPSARRARAAHRGARLHDELAAARDGRARPLTRAPARAPLRLADGALRRGRFSAGVAAKKGGNSFPRRS